MDNLAGLWLLALLTLGGWLLVEWEWQRHLPRESLTLGTQHPAFPGLRWPKVRLRPEDQAFHATIWGRTGSGKSKLLQSIFLQHLAQGHGVALIDPHHDLASDVVSSLVAEGFFRHPEAYQRLIYLDWGSGHVMPFNVLHTPARSVPADQVDDHAHTVALQVLDAAYRIWPELQTAPLFKELFLSSVLTLIANQLPLTYLHRVLDDAAFRAACLIKVTDPLVLQTWHTFDQLLPREQADKAGSSMRRGFELAFNPIARLALSMPENAVQHRRWMDEGVCVIHDLGRIKDRLTRRILGALLLVDLEQAAMSRADEVVRKRRPYTVLVDEWASFAAQEETISHVLSESRKYGLRLYLAAQSMSQISSERLAGALENCRLTIAFGLGRDSAVTQARQIAEVDVHTIREEAPTETQHNTYLPVNEQFEVWAQELQHLDTRVAYVKLHHRPAVKMKTLAVSAKAPDPDELAKVLATYRSRYQRTAQEAEAAMAALRRTEATRVPAAPRPGPAYTRVFK